MGYYTRFELDVKLIDENSVDCMYYIPTKYDIIKDFRQTCEYAEYCLEEDGSACQEGKWYDHETDLIAFSKNIPAGFLL